MAFTREELAALRVVKERCIASIYCFGAPLTHAERQAIGAAVLWTYGRMREVAPELAALMLFGIKAKGDDNGEGGDGAT